MRVLITALIAAGLSFMAPVLPVLADAHAAALLDSAQQPERPAPQPQPQQPQPQQPDKDVKVDIEVQRSAGQWYVNPVWIAIGVIGLVVLVLLIVVALRGGSNPTIVSK